MKHREIRKCDVCIQTFKAASTSNRKTCSHNCSLKRRAEIESREPTEQQKAYKRKYNLKSETKKKSKEWFSSYSKRPLVKKRIKEYRKKYYSLPENKKNKSEYYKKYSNNPINKANILKRTQEHQKKKFVIERRKIRNKVRRMERIREELRIYDQSVEKEKLVAFVENYESKCRKNIYNNSQKQY